MSDAKRSVSIDLHRRRPSAAAVDRAEAAGVKPSTVIEEAPRRFFAGDDVIEEIWAALPALGAVAKLQLSATPALLLNLRDVMMRGTFART
jgi:hypothetical protein